MTDRLVWIDCEMTGLDLRRDALIEVAVLVTDAELNVLDEGLDIVIHTHDDKPLLYSSLAVKLARVRRLIHTQHHGFLPSMTPRQRKLVAWAGRLTDAFVCVSSDPACGGTIWPSREPSATSSSIDRWAEVKVRARIEAVSDSDLATAIASVSVRES